MTKPDSPPREASNMAATLSISAALVGLLILPIILAPMAVICGFVGLNGEKNLGSAWCGILIGFGEIVWVLVQWANLGLLGSS